jgi:hypothetical protein
MIRAVCILGVVIAYAASASAAVTIEQHVLQKGYIVDANCKVPDNQIPPDDVYNPCACEADISYPQITGLNDVAAQASLNVSFKQAAEQAQCKGEMAQKPKAAAGKELPTPSSRSHSVEVTFQSAHMIGLEFTDSEYTGGAHGDGIVTGMIIDLDKAKPLATSDLIAPKDLPAVNDGIYQELNGKPEGEVFHEQIESRKGAFIKEDQCSGCTLTLTPKGVNIVFQTYEVAPYSSGNVAVTIPEKFISDPAVIQALAQQPHTTPAEKK